MIAWLKEEWKPLIFVIGIGLVGGFAGSAPMVIWFFRGVCG